MKLCVDADGTLGAEVCRQDAEAQLHKEVFVRISVDVFEFPDSSSYFFLNVIVFEVFNTLDQLVHT